MGDVRRWKGRNNWLLARLRLMAESAQNDRWRKDVGSTLVHSHWLIRVYRYSRVSDLAAANHLQNLD